jgi:iron complex transport system ATP-binding protein
MILQLHNLSVGYGQRVLLKEVSLAVPTPQLILLLGLNGIGKSTLLRTIAGLIPAVAGEVLINGQDVSSASPNSRASLVTGVFTGRDYDAYITVRELVTLGRYRFTGYMGNLGQVDIAAIEQVMELSGIRHLADSRVAHISDGERQKTLIAKALLQDTPLIVLDEPTAFLDYKNKRELLTMLYQLTVKSGKTILLSTHDIEASLPYAQRVVMINQDSQVIQNDCPISIQAVMDTLG